MALLLGVQLAVHGLESLMSNAFQVSQMVSHQGSGPFHWVNGGVVSWINVELKHFPKLPFTINKERILKKDQCTIGENHNPLISFGTCLTQMHRLSDP